MNSTLLHGKSRLVSFDELHRLPAPMPLGASHKPVPHADLVLALREEADRRGYLVVREQFALDAKDAKLFGVLDLTLQGAPSGLERGLSFGFRNSTNRSLAIKGVAGDRVMVCDNLTLSGDMIAIMRKNTVGLDLAAALQTGFEKFLQHATTLDQHIARMQARMITDMEAKAIIHDVFAARVLPIRLFDYVQQFYFHPQGDMTDCLPRTVYGLFNSFTRTVKALNPLRGWASTVALGQQFGLVSGEAEAIDEDADDEDLEEVDLSTMN
jgi:hypothetical protein